MNDPVEYFTSSLSQVIKDHNWPCAIDIAKESAINFVHNVFNRDFEHLQGIPMAMIDCDVHSVVPDDPRFSKRVLKIVIMKQCNPAVADEFKRSLQKTRQTDFRHDIVDFTTTESDQSDLNGEKGIPLKGNSSLMQCVDIVNRAMKLKDYRLHRGKFYSKVPESKYSFISCCSIGAFLDTLVANPNFTDVLAPNLKRLEELLSRSTCQLINEIEIDYNLIEVKPYGVCFSIAEKEFVTSPISYSEIGKITPRVYVSYTYEPSRVPLPKPFIDSLKNSFPGADIRTNFLRKYYQLLLHKKFPTKTKKLCVTGETDSGKSTWFSPFMGIIPTDCIAGVTSEKQFAGHLINENTEVVFKDEWSIDSSNA